jgi:alkylation response protein AidB-like acyl-CoA dehydrogenase
MNSEWAGSGTPELLRALLTGEAPPAPPTAPIDQALVAGARADKVADAFLAGYQAALRALVPDLPAGRLVCLCATEEGGAHPRAIAARLSPERDGWKLSGRKKWVTGASLADLLLVVAATGTDAAGRNALKVACVEPRQPGVTLEPMPATPFVPEIPHAEVRFDGVAVAAGALLPGDGYERYLKPFRTVEDCHVHAAVLAHVLGVARRFDWPREAMERLLAILLAARTAALADPSARETHLAVAGVIALGRRFLDETDELWERADAETRARWRRDVALLSVAERARIARTEAAWKALSPAR